MTLKDFREFRKAFKFQTLSKMKATMWNHLKIICITKWHGIITGTPYKSGQAFNSLFNQAQHPSMAPRTRTLTCSNCRSSSNTSCLSWENVVIASCLIGSLPLIMFLRMWPLAKAFVGAGWSSFGRMKLTTTNYKWSVSVSNQASHQHWSF